MSKTEIIVMCSIVVVLLIGIIISLTIENTTVKVESKLNEITNEDKIDSFANALTDDEMNEAFIDGCIEEGAPRSYCTCTYNYLDSRINDREMMQLAFDLVDGEIPDIMIDAVSECLYLFEY